MGNTQTTETFEQFDRFEDLPKPVLQEILLKLNSQQLYAICSISRKAYSICSEHNFRDMYNKIHPRHMIYGDLRETNYKPLWTQTDYDFSDEFGNVIKLTYSNSDKVTWLEYLSIGGKGIRFLITRSNKLIDWVGPKNKTELLERLKEIGKEHWVDQFIIEGNEVRFTEQLASEIWKIIKFHVVKLVPYVENVTLELPFFTYYHEIM